MTIQKNTVSPTELDRILEEVSQYKIDLSSDPTLPELGTKYLQESLSQCRNYSNRVQFYLQKCMRYEKDLKCSIKEHELDLEFKIDSKLADDGIVRKQSSIADRRAAATVMLKEEYENLAEMRARLIDVEETTKLLKMKYGDLRSTTNDIKMQRAMVKDDRMAQMGGEEGYNNPSANQDRTMSNGMPAPVSKPVNPMDLLDPNKRPEELPEPRDEQHANLIANYLNKYKERESIPSEASNISVPSVPTQTHIEDPVVGGVDYDSLLA